MDVILERDSVRKFTDREVDRTVVKEVLHLAGQAPSWKNSQPWRFILIDDPRVKEELAGCVPERNPGRASLTEAPYVVAVLGDPEASGKLDGKEYYLVDGGIVFAHLMLEAKSRGLDTCFIGFADEEKARDVLGFPHQFKLVGLTPLGYGKQPNRKTSRRALEENTSMNTYGKKLE